MLNIGSRRRSQARTVAREFLSAAGPGPRLYAVRRWRRSCARLDPHGAASAILLRAEARGRQSLAANQGDSGKNPPHATLAARCRSPNPQIFLENSVRVPTGLGTRFATRAGGGGRWWRVQARKSQMAVISNPRSGTTPIRATLMGLVILAAAAAWMLFEWRGVGTANGHPEMASLGHAPGTFIASETQWAALGVEAVTRQVFRAAHETEGKIAVDEDCETPDRKRKRLNSS